MAYNYGNYQGYSVQPQFGMMNQPVQSSYANQQYYQNYQVQQPQQSQALQSSNQGFVWVQGEAGAKAYPVAAGNSVLLMDSENPVLYMKSTDSSGRPLPIETYDLVKRENTSFNLQNNDIKAQTVDLSEYVKMSDLETKVTELVNKVLEQ